MWLRRKRGRKGWTKGGQGSETGKKTGDRKGGVRKRVQDTKRRRNKKKRGPG